MLPPRLMPPPDLRPQQPGWPLKLRHAQRMRLSAVVFGPAEPAAMLLQHIPVATESDFVLPKLPTLRRAEPRRLVLGKPDAMALQSWIAPTLELWWAPVADV